MEKYKKIKVIGKGSFGYALLAQHIQQKKPYIIKIIDISKMDRKQREEALNEVHVLKALRHPYIITYRESFMEKKCLCIVMDYADGGDLYARIARQKEIGQLFPEEQILDWFVQMALAMNHIHERKILHRDLKTQNIFLTSKGDVKIGDFGIARVLQHTYDCAQTAIGTPYYLSPEICQERPYNQKSDIWSLGCILYEMTTLNHAFDAVSIRELALKILRGTYPPISSQYSQELHGLIAEMLTIDPSSRPSIKRILEKEFIKARIGNLLVSTLSRHELLDLKKIEPEESKLPLQIIKQTNISQQQSTNNSPITQRQLQIQQQQSKSPNRPKKEPVAIVPNTKAVVGSIVTTNQDCKMSNYFSKPYQLKENIASKQLNIESNIKLVRDRLNSRERGEEQQFQGNLLLQKPKPIPDIIKKTKEEEDSLEAQGYGFLIKDMKKCLKKKQPEQEEETFIDNFKLSPQFLSINGRPFLVPGTNERDTIGYKIEALRLYLEKQIGADQFMKAYKLVSESSNSSMPLLNSILLREQKKFIPLIIQLIVCEDQYYRST